MANQISTSTNNLATSYPPNSLVAVAANGDAFVLWFDGTNVKYSYAAAPYTSWINTTLAASIGGGPRWQAGLSHNTSDDSIVVVTSNSSGNTVSYVFTYSSSGHSWSPGAANTVASGSVQFNGGSTPMCRDAQGRIWAAWANNSNVIQVYYSTNGTSWTQSTTLTQVGGGADNIIAMDYVGNYIVICYVNSSAALVYARVDAHAATIGSWSAAGAIPNTSVDNTANAVSFRAAGTSGYAMLVNDEGTNIPAQYYNATTDTWSSVSSIGAANDRDPTLLTDGTDLYCIWCAYAAASSYSLVYKKWKASTQTWDTASTQLEASGTNLQWPSGAYGNSSLVFVYTKGTASPWSVLADTLSLGGGGGTVNGSGSFVASGAITQAAAIKAPGTFAAGAVLSETVVAITAPGVFAASAGMSVSGAVVVAAGSLVANAALSASAQVAATDLFAASGAIAEHASILAGGAFVGNGIFTAQGTSPGGGTFAGDAGLTLSGAFLSSPASMRSGGVLGASAGISSGGNLSAAAQVSLSSVLLLCLGFFAASGGLGEVAVNLLGTLLLSDRAVYGLLLTDAAPSSLTLSDAAMCSVLLGDEIGQ